MDNFPQGYSHLGLDELEREEREPEEPDTQILEEETNENDNENN